jgi:predicted nucleotidyltransferase
MFTTDERERVLRDLISLAKAAPDVSAAAVTGSTATGDGDRWSDLDLALSVWGPLDAAIDRWTALLIADFGVLHHWDLRSGTVVYRAFLLSNGLEVDLGFYPEGDFGPRGPAWRPVFGTADQPATAGEQDPGDLIGHAWHHVLHARTSVARGHWWQAEHWIGATRTQVIALAALRLGLPASYAKGAHLLPDEVTASLTETLVRHLDEVELRRALKAVVAALEAELQNADPRLAAKLAPVLAEAVSADSV